MNIQEEQFFYAIKNIMSNVATWVLINYKNNLIDTSKFSFREKLQYLLFAF